MKSQSPQTTSWHRALNNPTQRYSRGHSNWLVSLTTGTTALRSRPLKPGRGRRTPARCLRSSPNTPCVRPSADRLVPDGGFQSSSARYPIEQQRQDKWTVSATAWLSEAASTVGGEARISGESCLLSGARHRVGEIVRPAVPFRRPRLCRSEPGAGPLRAENCRAAERDRRWFRGRS